MYKHTHESNTIPVITTTILIERNFDPYNMIHVRDRFDILHFTT